jgi:hypothetical protein
MQVSPKSPNRTIEFLLFASLTVILAPMPVALHAADQVKLESKATITLEFPELPETFFAEATEQKVPAMLTAELPDNYTREGRFPLCVFLGGGNGGPGTDNTARRIVGAHDFIAVSIPLFKDRSASALPKIQGVDLGTLGVPLGQIVLPSDAAKLGGAYRVMLTKLFDTVPNIDIEHSAFGGLSNGAHATAALLAAKDETLLGHFRAFYLVEGGVLLGLDPAVLEDPALKRCRFIALFGDHDSDPKLQAARALVAEPLLAAIAKKAAEQHIDFTRVTMTGHGHSFPPEYRKLLGCWVRGEALPEVK